MKKKSKSKVDEEFLMKALADSVLTDSKVVLGIFDFGGQKVFNAIHHFFLTRFGVYLVAFNMEDLCGSSEQLKKSLRYLHFWINSVGMHTQYIDADGTLKTAPLALVGTHKDKVPSAADHKRWCHISNV